MNNKSKLIIIRGPLGSGKTTVAKKLRDSLKKNTALINLDNFYWTIFGKNIHSSVAYGAIYVLLNYYLKEGFDVIIEGMLSSRDSKRKKRFEEIIKIGKKNKADVLMFTLDVSLETALKRDIERGNVVGEKEIRKYHNKYLKHRRNDEIIINGEKDILYTVNMIKKQLRKNK